MSAARTLPVTPAERFLAACLRAHQAWNADGAPQCPLDPAVLDIARTLAKYGVLAPTGIVTPAGAALLARVEAEPDRYEQGRRDAITAAADHLSACHDPTITPRNAARMIVDHEAAPLAKEPAPPPMAAYRREESERRWRSK